MSGGHFEYIQYRIGEAAEILHKTIDNIGVEDEFGFCMDYETKTKNIFIECETLLKRSEIILQRIDWLICGDDGEETFHKRLAEDLQELHK